MQDRNEQAPPIKRRRRLTGLRSWLFHTYRPNAAFIIAGVILWLLLKAEFEPPPLVWLVAAILFVWWFGFVLHTFRISPTALHVSPTVPLFTVFLMRRFFLYHDILRVRYTSFAGFWIRMEIITARGTLRSVAWSLRPNRRLMKDLKKYCPDKLKAL